MAEYVWYAGYGSNLNTSRFYYYITGGVFKPTGRYHSGCQDRTPPVKRSTFTTNHKLYFARKSGAWENKSVAFLTRARNNGFVTKCVLYLVTKKQFTDILIQENGSEPPMPAIVPELETAKLGEEVLVGRTDPFNWYGRLLYLGEHEGFPVYSFTSKDPDESIVAAEPGAKYIKVIGLGLKDNFEMSNNEAATYLMQQRGIIGSSWTVEHIAKLLANQDE